VEHFCVVSFGMGEQLIVRCLRVDLEKPLLNGRYRLRGAFLYSFDTEKHGQGKANDCLPFPVAGIWQGIRADSTADRRQGYHAQVPFFDKIALVGQGTLFSARCHPGLTPLVSVCCEPITW
jgi:hypothetical protein